MLQYHVMDSVDLNSTQLNFIKNCSLKAGLNEHRTHQNYKNTKLHIARLNQETNKRKHKKKPKNTVVKYDKFWLHRL